MRLIDADALRADCDIYNAWDAQIVKAWLDDQPTVSGWIPVSERLPEEEEQGDVGVIATVEGEEDNVTYQHGIVPDAWYEDGRWYVNGVRLENAKVTAWMPLPEPYREDREDGEA